jgi:hypothetical protein
MSSVIAPPAVPQVYDYWQFVPQPVGRVVEPLKPQGSRMQMRYIEDDFSLSYTQPSEFAIDVEQLYWSPFNDETVLFDVFDRFTMTLGHAKRRPDLHFNVFTPAPPPPPAPPLPPVCQFNCAGMNSSLALEFGDNLLEGTAGVEVFKDAIYRINPNEAFRTIDQVKYVPFPRFDRSYTWRDSRLVTVDDAGAVIGLGGALAPGNPVPNDDRTTNIDSPWIPSAPPAAFPGPVWVMDEGDFRGDRARDHDPIALPLLVDFKVFADNAVNGIVNGNNGFQVALLGPPPLAFPGQPGGYYDGLPSGCGGRPAWSRVRVQASGGFDLILPTQQIFIDPANQLIAQSSIVKDAGLGNPAAALFAAPAGDGMLNWARADFVRKESTMVFPFFDTLQPQRAEIADITGVFNAENGIPDLVAVSDLLRIRDLVVQIDPPQTRQPAGTSVVVEVRCAETFANSGVLYDPASATAANPETVANRGNLLNVNYACEAYRHSTANTAGAARVPATLLTRYVTEDQISRIRRPDGLLPRFMNVRLSMSNNVDVAPPLSPSLRSLSLVYRLQPGQ